MGMTIAEKILAAHCGRDRVRPGEYVSAKVDLLVGNEGSTILCIEEFEDIGAERVYDRDKIFLVMDHEAPNRSIISAEVCRKIREFARKHQITHFYEVGLMGISHVMAPERGLVGAGDFVVGGDSHTVTYGALGAFSTGVGSTDMLSAMVLGELWMRVPETIKIIYSGKPRPGVTGKDIILYTIGRIGIEGARYKAIEFAGETLEGLSMADRFTIANMTVEAGAKCGIFTPDQKTIDYMKGRCIRPYQVYRADEDAEYEAVLEFDVSDLDYQVAMPHLPENVMPVSEMMNRDKVWLDQVFIGSCTNGRLEDLRAAANILKDRKTHKNLRLVVIPGSQDVYLDALKEGIIETLIRAGAAVSTPTCGACVGTHMGLLASGEVCAATTNRNFVGRMGHKDSFVYLVSPAVAAASAVMGYIAVPESIPS